VLTKTDFLGNEYKAGDFVIYAVSQSQSINMIKGQVVEILESGKVKILPLAGSRWESHRGHTYSVDNRTGKKINPWSSNGKHIKAEAYYLAPDGRKYSMEEANKLPYPEREKITRSRNYVSTVFHDYVESRTDPVKPVTITVTENIVKFADGELPTEG
jgi:hypothetical protein